MDSAAAVEMDGLDDESDLISLFELRANDTQPSDQAVMAFFSSLSGGTCDKKLVTGRDNQPFSGFSANLNIQQEQDALMEEIDHDLDKELESFTGIYDKFENKPYEKNRGVTSQDGVPKLELEWHTPLLGKQSLPAEVMIIPSKKKSDYKVNENTLATKRSRPVNFKLLRVKPGIQVSIFLTYPGYIYGDEPVKHCKKHDDCSWCKEHKFNQGFCILSKYHSYDLDHKGHTVAVLTPLAEHLDVDGNAEFSVVFSCWNTCDNHKRYGKELVLNVHVMEDGQVVKKVEYAVQCWGNLPRDAFKDRKRKLCSQSEDTLERPSKAAATSSKTSISSPKRSIASSKKAIISSASPVSSPPGSLTNTNNGRSEKIVVVIWPRMTKTGKRPFNFHSLKFERVQKFTTCETTLLLWLPHSEDFPEVTRYQR